jgi:hypothetical protein
VPNINRSAAPAFRRREPPMFMSLASLALTLGCAGARTAAPPSGNAATTSANAAAAASTPQADSAALVLEVRLRRSAELSNTNGALRVFDQDLNVQYRAHGQGPGIDAGEVTYNGRPMSRSVSGKGAVNYRTGRDAPDGGEQAGGDPWSTIANSGSPRVPAAAAAVKLAPYPLVTQPAPWQGISRTQDLSVVMLPPVPDLWIRVSMVGAGETVIADDLGEGRFLFTVGRLADLHEGRAHILIEVESTCGSCRGPGALRLNWSSHTELEIPLTLL